MPRKTIELQGKENQPLKGPQADSLDVEITTKTPDRKVHSPLVKETHLLSSECISQEQEAAVLRHWQQPLL